MPRITQRDWREWERKTRAALPRLGDLTTEYYHTAGGSTCYEVEQRIERATGIDAGCLLINGVWAITCRTVDMPKVKALLLTISQPLECRNVV